MYFINVSLNQKISIVLQMKTKDYYNINYLTKENSMRYKNKLKEKNAIKILST